MGKRFLMIAIFSALLAPTCACAAVEHVVQPGESLTSVAATDGLTVSALAAANGLSPTSELIAGELIKIPPLTPATSAVQASAQASTSTPLATSVAVRPTPVTSVAVTPTPVTATPVTAGKRAARTPHPTVERVNAAELATVAQANDVPADLVEAVAWQESGWNNDELSADGAVGVMQITPSTWRWIDRYLSPGDPLNGNSAVDNIRAGVLLLRQLLSDTGSQRRTIEAYYQGLASVEQDGVYSSTRRYVRDVLAIERQLAD